MSVKKRQTLKNYFLKGALPSEGDFGNFIDSVPNIVDDGISKTPEDGFRVTAIGRHDRLVSFSREGRARDTLWSVSLTEPADNLTFESPQARQPVLTFSTGPRLGERLDEDALGSGRIGINQPEPSCALDVEGAIRASGRIGGSQNGATSVPADGNWHDITDALDGCHAFEVVAGVGSPRQGRYALLRAHALNAYNPTGWIFNFFNLKKRVRAQHAYYGSKADKLALRWRGGNHDYRLQLRSNTSYGDGVAVRFYITRLWFDPSMGGSRVEADDK